MSNSACWATRGAFPTQRMRLCAQAVISSWYHPTVLLVIWARLGKRPAFSSRQIVVTLNDYGLASTGIPSKIEGPPLAGT